MSVGTVASQQEETVGLIPAAGYARRISPLPCSKELYPIGFRGAENQSRPKVVSHYLLEKMRYAGITKAYIVLRKEKWDIPSYFADGSIVGMHLAYLALDLSHGVPFTLDRAYPFVRHARVTFGFPDILFRSEDGFLRLLTRQSETQADIILGLFPADRSSIFDRVDLDKSGTVRELHVGPFDGPLRYTWAAAVWSPNFTEFLHRFVGDRIATAVESPELSAGHVVKAALDEGLRVDGLVIDEEPYLDIGTAPDLAKAVRDFASR
jgi:glucose-1-phosphate thymidylyltransferase